MNMGYNNEIEDSYSVPLIAKLLHSLPHYNITFHKINNKFRPDSEIYLESLGIFACAPAALLILSLFGLLLYLMTRCCDRTPRSGHSITSLKIVLSTITVLCCASIGLGLYGNDDLHSGLLEVLTAGRKVDNLVSSVRNQTNALEHTLTAKIKVQLTELEDIFDSPASNQTALSLLIHSLEIVKGNISIASTAVGDIRRPIQGISMGGFLTKGDQYELIRWPGTVAVLALLLVLCAVLLVGVARHSRVALILFSVCGLLAVTGSWLMSGLYLSTSVAVGDLCTDPSDYLVAYKPHSLPADILLYYTQCESARANPFTQRIREIQNAINNARNSMNIVSRISLDLFKNSGLNPKLGSVQADLNISERLLTGLTALVDCKAIHFNYLNATRGLCEVGLIGLVLMLVASFIAAILLTIMVYVDSHTWIYIKKRNDYAQVEEQSYMSNMHQQQQLPPNHPNHQQAMSRTLPRQPQQNGPPVISGSHTLAHPSKNHYHPNMRAMGSMGGPGMGTHTLGRLPSHNHSPNHMMGPVNNNGQQMNPTATLSHYKQYPNQPYPENLPPPMTSVPQIIATGNPAYTQQQQQQIYMQQQQIYQHQQTLRRQMQMTQNQPQYVQSQPQYVQSVQQPHSQPQQIYHQQPQQQQAGMAQQQQIHLQQQQQQPQQQQPPATQAIHVSQIPSSIAMNNPNNSIYVQTKTFAPETVTVIPSSNIVDSDMFERDKQIYKCSTLRHGGKYDLHKPSVIPAVIPTVPKIPNKFSNVQEQQLQQQQATSITNRPLPEIPKTEEIPKELPYNRFYTQKRVPTGKPIALPKIGSFESNTPISMALSSSNNNTAVISSNPINSDSNCNIKNNNNNLNNTSNNINLNQNQSSNHVNNNTSTFSSNNNEPPAPASTTLSPNDIRNDEFYAVTEL